MPFPQTSNCLSCQPLAELCHCCRCWLAGWLTGWLAAAAAGSARQGKSFLMNKLAGGEGCGFKVSNKQDPCTVGVDLAANTVSLASFAAVEASAALPASAAKANLKVRASCLCVRTWNRHEYKGWVSASAGLQFTPATATTLPRSVAVGLVPPSALYVTPPPPLRKGVPMWPRSAWRPLIPPPETRNPTPAPPPA
jgi:hypothetical protein